MKPTAAMEPFLRLPTEEALRRFVERGYRPTIKSHALRYRDDLMEEGWAVLSGIQSYWGQEEPPEQECIGWMVDAQDVTGRDRQVIVGGTFPKVAEALAYALVELDKYAPETEEES